MWIFKWNRWNKEKALYKSEPRKTKTNPLDALQDFHQLSLLIRSHSGKHGASQRKLQHPHVDKKGIYYSKVLQLSRTEVCTAYSGTTDVQSPIECLYDQLWVRTFWIRWGKCSVITSKALPLKAKWYLSSCTVWSWSQTTSSTFISTHYRRKEQYREDLFDLFCTHIYIFINIQYKYKYICIHILYVRFI